MRRRATVYGYVLAALIGAALAFLLDPDRGAYRRSVTGDRLSGLARRGGRRLERAARRARSDTRGIAERVERGDGTEELDDATLAQKVMSEVFGDPRVPKGAINVNAENGIVYLRGEVEDSGTIVWIVERTRDVDGVVDVENLLHLPGETVPRA